MSKLNREVHFYSTRELDAVLGSLNDDLAMRRVIAQAKRKHVQFSSDVISEVGRELGTTSAATAVIAMLERNRNRANATHHASPVIAGDDDVLTAGQLREAVTEVVRGFAQGRWVTAGNAGDFVDQVMEHVNHPWSAGDIVEDALGCWYKRAASGEWLVFGNSGSLPDNAPARPLKKRN